VCFVDLVAENTCIDYLTYPSPPGWFDELHRLYAHHQAAGQIQGSMANGTSYDVVVLN
jgi:hypothetical protein